MENKNPDPVSQPAEGNPKQVLLIEDDPTTAELVKKILSSNGFGITLFPNGKQALENLFTAAKKPDLVISDVLMPEMDGYAFLKELRKSTELKSTPVLIITSRKNMEDSFLAVGAEGFLAKPIDTKKLLEFACELTGQPLPAKKSDPPPAPDNPEPEQPKDPEKKPS